MFIPVVLKVEETAKLVNSQPAQTSGFEICATNVGSSAPIALVVASFP
jgi:hypothetical protein